MKIYKRNCFINFILETITNTYILLFKLLYIEIIFLSISNSEIQLADKCCEDEITKYKKKFDSDSCTQPCDDLRNYAFEGGGSISGSLSSLASSMKIF